MDLVNTVSCQMCNYVFIGYFPAKSISVYVGLTSHSFINNGAYACALNITSLYMGITIQCVAPVRGRFLTIVQSGERNGNSSHHGLEICDLRVYGQGENY